MRSILAVSIALSLCLVNLLPLTAQASTPIVVISEVAWAGSSLNDADEWLELANLTNAEIDLTNWSIEGAKTGKLTLVLPALTIGARQTLLVSNYAMGDPNSALAIEPEFVTTALSLPNSGLSLKLLDASGALMDEVIGNSLGASGTSKASMERISLGFEKADWRTATEAVNLAASGSDLGTPGVSKVIPALVVPEPSPDPNPITPEPDPTPIPTISDPAPAPPSDPVEPPAPIESSPAVDPVIVADPPLPALTSLPATLDATTDSSPIFSEFLSAPTADTGADDTNTDPTPEIQLISLPEQPAPAPVIVVQAAPMTTAYTVDHPPVAPPGYQPGEIVINEFMSAPVEESEWIELRSRLPDARDLNGYWVTDATGKKTELTGIITAYSYYWFENPKGKLNNGGDTINLFAPDGTLIDQVVYGPGGIPAPKAGQVEAREDLFASTFALSTIPSPGAENQFNATADSEATIIDSGTNDAAVSLPSLTPTLNPPPVLKISGPTEIYVGQTGLFTAAFSQTVGGQPDYRWALNSGIVGREKELRYSFPRAGNYVLECSAQVGTSRISTKFSVSVFEFGGAAAVVANQNANPGANGKNPTPVPAGKIKSSSVSGSTRSSQSKRVSLVNAVTLDDVVTMPPGILGKNVLYLGVKGTQVNLNNQTVPNLAIGDRVIMTGTKSNTMSGVKIKLNSPQDLQVLESGNEVTPIQTSSDELSDGQIGYLVSVQGIVKQVSRYTIMLDDGAPIKVTLKVNAKIPVENIKTNDELLVVGLVQKVDNQLQIIPRGQMDIQIIQKFTEPIALTVNHSKKLPAYGNLLIAIMAVAMTISAGIYFYRQKFMKAAKQALAESELNSFKTYEE
ncbi:MAG: lamin tail domain-containing protein [bacterium]